jgi:hypothetical protein
MERKNFILEKHEKKEYEGEVLSLVNCVTSGTHVHKRICKEYEGKNDSKIELQTSTLHILAYWH